MLLPTLQITADHVKDAKYIGPDMSDYQGNIEIAPNLRWVKFPTTLPATDPATLRRVYRKFDPAYLRETVRALEL